MDKIFIENYVIETTIGVHEWEQKIKQKLILDIELAHDLSKAGKSDKLEDSLDYMAIQELVTSFAGAHNYKLLESFAENLAGQLQGSFTVPWLKLKITKPGVIKGAKAVGIVIERGEN